MARQSWIMVNARKLRSFSLRKQPTFRNVTAPVVFPDSEKPRAQKFQTDDTLPPKSGWCFWLVEKLLHAIRSTIQIWVVTCHQYGISALASSDVISQGSIETSSVFSGYFPITSFTTLVVSTEYPYHICVFHSSAGFWSTAIPTFSSPLSCFSVPQSCSQLPLHTPKPQRSTWYWTSWIS